MDNDYDHIYDNYDSAYTSDNYIDNSSEAINSNASVQAADIQPQQVYVQTPRVITQPVNTQPIYTQPIYTQPIIMPMADMRSMAFPTQGYIPIDELKTDRWNAPPFLVFAALLLCPPIGLILLLFFTKWGVFPKFFLTIFTFVCIWVVYEIIAFYTDFGIPSLLNELL